MKRNHVLLISVVFLLVFLGTVGGAVAQEPEPQDNGVQGVLGTGFIYQGRLTNDSSPVKGRCDFQFALYDAAIGGNQIGST